MLKGYSSKTHTVMIYSYTVTAVYQFFGQPFNESGVSLKLVTYILLNGLTYNPAEYFTSFERIFPSPERARKNARNE